MAVLIRTTDFPEGVGTQMYDGVKGELNVEGDPPDGMLFHCAGEIDGKWTVTNVWESREHYDSFREGRLYPAIQKVSGQDPAAGPQPTISEFQLHDYVKP